MTLDSLKGRWVVLEWTNRECTFVQKHYGSGNMQATQKFAADNRMVWVQLDSTGPRHKDHYSPANRCRSPRRRRTVVRSSTERRRHTLAVPRMGQDTVGRFVSGPRLLSEHDVDESYTSPVRVHASD
ncbi:MAG: hypothetical protein AW07_02498 [Candidatus Accumulibacter sp. SK-11]|nr:MAG: hypothetical protein AW07_02498 [Candidatus Accumulibacter sp. SK-11]